ncbi:MAG: helix-turn-helix domain-containing protein [Mariprofundaceae bacterium]
MNEIQDAIMNAAESRFADYGYNKTTMAEIAADCDMSVGNLYRHFKNKEAIAVGSMRRLLDKKLQAGCTAAQDKQDAFEALSAFLLARLRLAHSHFAGNRHLFELLELTNCRHRQLLLDFETKVIAAMSDIIQRGINEQRFRHMDADQTAYDIHQAMLRYNNPLTLKGNALAVLEADLLRLLDLLRDGLKAC